MEINYKISTTASEEAYHQGNCILFGGLRENNRKLKHSIYLLIDIARILGVTRNTVPGGKEPVVLLAVCWAPRR